MKTFDRIFMAVVVSALLSISACTQANLFTPTAAGPKASAPRPLPTLTPTPAPRPDVFFVDPNTSLGTVSPWVFGTNYGPWIFLTNAVKPKAIAAKLSLLRIPGGNWGDQNDLDERQIDQLVALARELGAEPAISVRLRGGTPEKAAALVQYCNQVKKYNVRFWSIGNEPNLYPNYSIQQFNQDWQTYAAAMRAVDATIQLLGPETNQFSANLSSNPKDSTGKDWLEEFLKVNGQQVDIVTVHRYPFPKDASAPSITVDELLASSAEWDEILPVLRSLIRQNAGKDLPVGITEVNSSWAANKDTDTSLDSFANALWWGDALGRMMRQGTSVVAQFALVGEFGLMDKYEVVPTYGVYPMFQKFGQELIFASSPDPWVSLFAARQADGKITLLFVNRADHPVSAPLQWKGTPPGSTAETWLFDETHFVEKVPAIPLEPKVELPPRSMLLSILNPR